MSFSSEKKSVPALLHRAMVCPSVTSNARTSASAAAAQSRLQGDLEREVRDKTESLRQALVEAHREKHSVVYLAEHDALTGLLNRRRFLHETGRWLEHVQRYNYPVALVFLDLDHFKRVNDTHGHEAGDSLLRALGDYLVMHVRAEDIARGHATAALVVPELAESDEWKAQVRQRRETETGQQRQRDFASPAGKDAKVKVRFFGHDFAFQRDLSR